MIQLKLRRGNVWMIHEDEYKIWVDWLNDHWYKMLYGNIKQQRETTDSVPLQQGIIDRQIDTYVDNQA